MISVNDRSLTSRAEQVLDKGTNRASFFRGEVTYYQWTDTGSSFLLSDINAAFLASQLEESEVIMASRRKQWEHYFQKFRMIEEKGLIKLPEPPCEGFNFYSFHIILRSSNEREMLEKHLLNDGIQAVSHYRNLAISDYIKRRGSASQKNMPNATMFQERLLRMPMWMGLQEIDIDMIADSVNRYFRIDGE